MDLISLGMSNAYTNKKVEQLETGITSIENEGDKLIFHLLNGNTVECSIVGLSDENYTLEEKTKLSLLDDSILKRFSYIDGELLFDGKALNDNTIDLTNYIDIATFNSHAQDKTNPHGVTIQNIKNVSIQSLLDNQTLVYDLASDTWKNESIAITNDGKIKLKATDTNLSYLSELIDNSTITIENDKLIIDKLNGLETTKIELGYIHGLDKNIMTYLNAISNVMTFKGIKSTDEELNSIVEKYAGDTYIVKMSVSNDNKAMTFVYDGTTFQALTEVGIKIRDFTLNPINLESEVTGVLPINKVDTTTLALKNDLNNYLDKENHKGSNNGIVKQADTLTGLTKTISQLNNSLDKDSIIEGNNIQIVKNDNGTITISCNSAMSGGGHTIVDSTNTELPQETKLKFGEDFVVTDDIESNTTKVDLLPSIKNELNNNSSAIGDLKLRTHIGEKLDYGLFGISISSNLTIPANSFIKFDMISNANIQLVDNLVHLKPNRTYRIISAISCNLNANIGIYDSYGNMYGIRALSYNGNNSQSTTSAIINVGTTELKIGIKCSDNKSIIIEGKNSYLLVEEISRQVLLDACEEGKNIEFEHGVVNYSSSTSLGANIDIPYSSHVGNLDIDSNGNIVLKQGKTYKITVSNINGAINASGGYSILLKNVSNFVVASLPATYTSNRGVSQINFTEITPTVDTLIRPYANAITTVVNICVEIEEIAHPYYFNYYKDSMSSKVLFDGNANVVGVYSLLDSIENYEYLDVMVNMNLATGLKNVHNTIVRVYPKYLTYNLSNSFIANFSSNVDRRLFFLFTDKNTLKIDAIMKDTALTSIQTTKVIGWGFNYDNPYKDMVSTLDVNSLTTEQLTTLKAKLNSIT